MSSRHRNVGHGGNVALLCSPREKSLGRQVAASTDISKVRMVESEVWLKAGVQECSTAVISHCTGIMCYVAFILGTFGNIKLLVCSAGFLVISADIDVSCTSQFCQECCLGLARCGLGPVAWPWSGDGFVFIEAPFSNLSGLTMSNMHTVTHTIYDNIDNGNHAKFSWPSKI